MYINGLEVASGVTSKDMSNFNKALYSESISSVGKIDEVQIYNRVLSPDEIKNIAQGNLIVVGKGCISDSTPTPEKPLQIISQVQKNIANGETANSLTLIKAYNSPIDTTCQICATPLGGGGCVDVRVIVK